MPISKLGSLSSLDVQKTQEEHWETDQKIRDILSVLPLAKKKQLLMKLPGVIGSLEGTEKDINTGE